MHAEIYSDGSFNPATGQAGWACVVHTGGQRIEHSGALAASGVLEAEMRAALEGVLAAQAAGASSATMYTDSTTIIDLAAQRRPAPATVAQATAELLRAQQHIAVRWVWVRAHIRGASTGNARADALARAAAFRPIR